eukprot:TRINITY_DN1166_c0_g1_i6.p1 TRINITY_DN1166_c0_g1~~TRINITY_DN1166_c0_g1_i6.p1  ORF type:complete len:506 (+),score=222.01 TRINITY_DN1166_c0_g1_i6:79-1518(+)
MCIRDRARNNKQKITQKKIQTSSTMSSEPRKRSGSPQKAPISEEELRQIEERRAKAARGIQKRSKKVSFLEKYQYQLVIGGFVALCGAALLSFLFSDNRKLSAIPVVEQEEIDSHNSNDYSFKLGTNAFYENWMLADAKQIMSNALSTKPQLSRCTTYDQDSTIVPDKYNFREKFPRCAGPIQDQGNCSSSYAFASLGVLADRFCQSTYETDSEKIDLFPRFSVQQILSCDKGNSGCRGGAANTVFDFARREGVVDEECLAYQGVSDGVTCPTDTLTSCARYKAVEYCVTNSEEGIKREILKNGPVVAVLPVYRDFLVYASGYYQVLEGTSKFQGGHLVKVIGWGKNEVGQGYWIIENSWGTTWGLEGFGYILTGQKQMYIEDFVLAVTPSVDRKTEAESEESGEAAAATNDEFTPEINLDENQDAERPTMSEEGVFRVFTNFYLTKTTSATTPCMNESLFNIILSQEIYCVVVYWAIT